MYAHTYTCSILELHHNYHYYAHFSSGKFSQSSQRCLLASIFHTYVATIGSTNASGILSQNNAPICLNTATAIFSLHSKKMTSMAPVSAERNVCHKLRPHFFFLVNNLNKCPSLAWWVGWTVWHQMLARACAWCEIGQVYIYKCSCTVLYIQYKIQMIYYYSWCIHCTCIKKIK